MMKFDFWLAMILCIQPFLDMKNIENHHEYMCILAQDIFKSSASSLNLWIHQAGYEGF